MPKLNSLPQVKTEAIEQKYPKSSFIAGVAGKLLPLNAAASAIPGVGPVLGDAAWKWSSRVGLKGFSRSTGSDAF